MGPRQVGNSGVAGVALPWLLGTLCVHELPAMPEPVWYVPLGLVALVALGSRRMRWLLWAIAAFCWTALYADARLAERLPADSNGRDFAITGWIDGFPSSAPGQITFSFTVDRPAPPGVPPRLRLTWYRAPEGLAAGTPLSLVVRLRAPRGSSNPGGFDYERWLFLEGYGATGYVRSGGVRDGAGRDLRRAWLRLRADLARRIDAAAPNADAAALLTALAIGERFHFTEQHWTDLRRTGTSHLVAISGMHVGLIATLAFMLARRLWLRLPAAVATYDLEAAGVAGAAGAIGYAALAGFAIPTQRAVLMIAVALAMLLSRRSASASNGLAAALLAVLVWDPTAPLAASFWLSFIAVGLLVSLNAEHRFKSAPPTGVVARAGITAALGRGFATLCRLQWAISLGLVPLTVLFFAEVSIVAPLVNLVVIPLFSFVLVPLTLLAALALVLGQVGDMLLQAAAWVANGAWALIGAAAAVPWAAVSLAGSTPWAIALAGLGVLLGLPLHPLPGRALAWLAVLPLFTAPPGRLPPPGVARLVVLDVGHGLAAVVETRGHRLLFDAGARYPSGFDVGREIVVPALAGGPLDTVIVSHADNDHAGGATAVLERFPNADLLQGPDVETLAGRVCRRGQHWVWDDVEFDIVHPAPDFPWFGNESSCVLRVAASTGSILLTGDIEVRAERRLVGDPALRADVVVVPHHGSATSSSAGFVGSTGARLALVSAGHGNRWGFPRPEVRRRWEQAGAVMLVTGDCGAVSLELAAGGLQVESERAERRRYWHADAATCRAQGVH
jgi:competence protein ComEC